MSEDAKFEDGLPSTLRLKAEDADDLNIISTLVQDAVFPASEMTWQASKHRAGFLINRYRWENQSRSAERVQSVLAFDDIVSVASIGIDKGDADTILSMLSLTWEPGEDGTGRLEMTLAGDGAIAMQAECINVTLQDVTQNYLAPSGKTPKHPE